MAVEDFVATWFIVLLVYGAIMAFVPIWIAWGIWRVGDALYSQKRAQVEAINNLRHELRAGSGHRGTGPEVARMLAPLPSESQEPPIRWAPVRYTVSPQTLGLVNVGLAATATLGITGWLAMATVGLPIPMWVVFVAGAAAVSLGILRLALMGATNAPEQNP